MMAELSETDRIEHDLELTRARLDSRLDELQDHLTPRQMVNDAFAYFRGGGGAEFSEDLTARIKANPLPAALAVIGIAWLIASSSKAKPKPAPTLRGIQDAAGENAMALQQGAPDMPRSARDRITSVGRNPFALGAIAAAVGAVAGALIPTLDKEKAALGPAATRARTKGLGLAQEVVDRGGRIANETLGAVKDSAEEHGLTADKPLGELLGDVRSGGLVEDVKQVARETLQAGKDSAQTHLSGVGAAAPGHSGA